MDAANTSKTNQSLDLILECTVFILDCREGNTMTNAKFSLNLWLFYFALVCPKTEI